MLIDNITTNHQFEIQQILKDAAVRIGKFKEIVDTKQNQVNNEVIIEKLTKKYEQEKGIPNLSPLIRSIFAYDHFYCSPSAK